MNRLDMDRYGGLFVAITNLRTELNILGYDFELMSIYKTIKAPDIETPIKIGGLTLLTKYKNEKEN